jgi:hypothetical protein
MCTVAFVIYMCEGKCRRAEEIEEGDRKRERDRDVEKENTEM